MAQNEEGLVFGGTVGIIKPHGSGNDSGVTIGGRLGKPSRAIFREADLNLASRWRDRQRPRLEHQFGRGLWRMSHRRRHPSQGKSRRVSYWDDDLDNDISLSAGIGIGIRIGRGIIDIEYTQINDYVDYFTVGYSCRSE